MASAGGGGDISVSEIYELCVQKLCQLIVFSRTADHRQLFGADDVPQRLTFNLMVPSSGQVFQKLREAVRVEPDGFRSKIHINVFLRALDPNAPAVGGRLLARPLLLEHWTVEWDNQSIKWERDGKLGIKSAQSEMYKKMIILCRSVFAFARLVPCHQLHRILQETEALRLSEELAEPPPYQLEFSITTGARVPMFEQVDKSPDDHTFPRIFVPAPGNPGHLCVSVQYRADCSEFAMRPVRRAPVLEPRIHEDHYEQEAAASSEIPSLTAVSASRDDQWHAVSWQEIQRPGSLNSAGAPLVVVRRGSQDFRTPEPHKSSRPRAATSVDLAGWQSRGATGSLGTPPNFPSLPPGNVLEDHLLPYPHQGTPIGVAGGGDGDSFRLRPAHSRRSSEASDPSRIVTPGSQRQGFVHPLSRGRRSSSGAAATPGLGESFLDHGTPPLAFTRTSAIPPPVLLNELPELWGTSSPRWPGPVTAGGHADRIEPAPVGHSFSQLDEDPLWLQQGTPPLRLLGAPQDFQHPLIGRHQSLPQTRAASDEDLFPCRYTPGGGGGGFLPRELSADDMLAFAREHLPSADAAPPLILQPQQQKKPPSQPQPLLWDQPREHEDRLRVEPVEALLGLAEDASPPPEDDSDDAELGDLRHVADIGAFIESIKSAPSLDMSRGPLPPADSTWRTLAILERVEPDIRQGH